ncbi:MAG: hypothetical protein GF331_05165 [Chitinivibrionales bacterium]|nr:hypothetical protein [Chitinivibrionales bacterium]
MARSSWHSSAETKPRRRVALGAFRGRCAPSATMQAGRRACPGIGLAGAALALLAGALPAAAYIGGESGAYLRSPVGATAFSLAGAYSAAPTHLASWWNPAMLSTYRSRTAALGMGVRSLGRMESFGSFSFPIPTRFGMGVSLLYRGDPFIDEFYDENGEKLDTEGGAYTTLTLKTAVSYLINRRWSAGVGVGVYYQSLPTAIDLDGGLATSTVTGIGGFTLAVRYEPFERWTVSALMRNVGLSMDWEIESSDRGYGNVHSSDKPVPELVLGSRFTGSLLDRRFVWSSELVGYMVDGDWERLPHAEAQWHNGFEWQAWETFAVRLGLGEIMLNSSIYDDEPYWDRFTMRVAAGFGWDLQWLREGMLLNYSIATDKSGALFDQVLDVTYTF